MSGKGGGANKNDSYMGVMLMMLFFFIMFLMLWHFQQDTIKDGIRWVRYFELWIISFFVDDSFKVTTPAGDLYFKDWFPAIAKIPKGDLNTPVMSAISTLAMDPLKYFFAALLFAFGMWSMFMGPNTNHRRRLGLDGLIEAQAKTFKTISPFIDFNPSKMPHRPPGAPVPSELPLFSEALSPEEWLAFHSIPTPDGKVDPDAAANAFMKQLGKPWRGYKHLPPYKQVLLATFCLKAARKRADADTMISDLAECWTAKDGLKLSPQLLRRARGVLANKDLCGTTFAKCNQHAFESTALMRALLTAREEGGVLAPASFVWLRGYDRATWYPLNNLGRQAYHMEALGAMAHFKAEKFTQRPIPRAKVDDAVKTITEYMASDRARPIPSLDYSKSKKKSGVKKLKGSG